MQRNLVFVLDTCMRLLHPVMPFVTESVWDALPASGLDDHSAEFLMVAPWPEPEAFAGFANERAERDFELAKAVVSAVRSCRARYRLSPKAELAVHVRASAETGRTLGEQAGFIRSVGRINPLVVGTPEEFSRPEGCVSVVCPDFEAYVQVGDLVDLAAESERVSRELAKAEKELAGVRRTLSNQGFVAKAAPAVIEKKRAQATELASTIEQLKAQVADLS